jgi:hypothetical protein
MRPGSNQRVMVEMALVGVVATQLWHHTFIDASLADLPSAVGSGQWAVGREEGPPAPGDRRAAG